MQPISNGPDIPDLLLRAHEDGNVVFFCGAGISYQAGLPGFKGLVERVYAALGVTPNNVQRSALRKKQYDTAIGLLEQDISGGRRRVREELAKVLTPDPTKAESIETHKALLALAQSDQYRAPRQTRLITTNFDRLFEPLRIAAAVPHYNAPLLPVPKLRWNGLVYLHGLLPDQQADSGDELEKLVVSSGDFGLAYLTERWASRFVTELFRYYTVCFVGYSIDDPVLRYMMDALAADKLLGEAPVQAFAFGAYSPKSEERTREEWKAKNVVPILYRQDNTHSNLHRTLKAWAEIYRDGISGRERIVVQHAGTPPAGSTVQDNYVGRMLWALSDKSGVPALRFATLDPLPPLSWLEAFSESRFKQMHLPQFGVSSNKEEDPKLTFSFVQRPTPYTLAPFMAIVRRDAHAPRLDRVMGAISTWLVRHLDEPDLLIWVGNHGGELDPLFARQIAERMKAKPLAGPIAQLWQLVLAGRVRSRESLNIYAWISRFKDHGVTIGLRLLLRELLRPMVVIRAPYKLPDAWKATDAGPSTRAKDFVSSELVLGSDYVHAALKDLYQNALWKSVVVDLLSDLTGLLRDAMDIRSALGEANDQSDLSYLFQPSIGEHSQNNDFYDWTALIVLLRDSWLANLQLSPLLAKAEVERWRTIRYPLFRRLTFFGIAESVLYSPAVGLNILLEDQGRWIWSTEVQREAMQLLSWLAPRLDRPDWERLEEAIRNGPPAGMFESTDSAKLERAFASMVASRLIKLAAFGTLGTTSQALLDQLRARFPWITDAADEREDFPVWHSNVMPVLPTQHVPVGRREIVKWLLEHPTTDLRLDQLDDWFERCQRDFRRPAAALLDLARQNNWSPVKRWMQALQAWSNDAGGRKSWRYLGPSLAGAPDSVIAELAPVLGWWLESVSKVFSTNVAAFFLLAERILSLYRDEQIDADDPDVDTIFNHPVNRATEAAFHWWYRQKPQDGQMLTAEVRVLLNMVGDTAIPSFRFGRVVLAANVVSLLRVDAEWTKKHVLPLFDWDTSSREALAAWKGFLWSPRGYPLLVALLKKSLLATVEHLDKLGELRLQYAGFFTYLALEMRDLFSKVELRSATSKFSSAELARAAHTVNDALTGAGDKAGSYWRNRAHPYFSDIWPKSSRLMTPSLSEALARVAITAGDAFPEAVAELRAAIVYSEHPAFVIHALRESKQCSDFPEAALEFVNAIVDDNAIYLDGDLKACLDIVLEKAPSLENDWRMQRLRSLLRSRSII
jgi:SIR2-like domain